MDLTLRRTEEELHEIYDETQIEQELKLEARMCSMGQRQIRKQIEKAREKGSESGTSYGKSLLARSVDRVAEAIESFKEKAKQGAGRRHLAVKYLDQLDSDIASYIALRLVIDSLTGRRKMVQRVAIQIGKRIEDEVRFAAFAGENRGAYNAGLQKAKRGTTYQRKVATMSGYERRFTEGEWQAWPETDCLHVGMVLIDMIVGIELVQIGTEVRRQTNTVKVVEPTARIAEWIEREAERSELLAPALLPMLCKPLPYTTPFDGGYLTQEANGRNTMVKVGNPNYLTEMADNAGQMPMVFDAINALQDTGWRINSRVREVLETMWEAGHALAKLPSRDDNSHCPCPQCGELVELPKMNSRGGVEHGCFEEPEVLRQWKSDAHEIHSTNVSLRSKRMSVAKTLYIADIYKDAEAFYFPYQLDFRGRVYAVPNFNPQGNDVTKGLLQFSEGMAIEDGVGAGWLAIHGANVFGYDKASLEERIQWVEDHEEEIMGCAVDPYGCRFWHGADKPWQFLAFCFEWADFMETGYGYVSRMAVALDGSCSGIQHFSAMLRDEVGGDAVNLIPSETPSDIYQKVCDRVVEKLKRDAGELSSTIDYSYCEIPSSSQKGEEAIVKAIATEPEEKDAVCEEVVYLATAWLKLEPNRKTTKRQVMTLPYGATEYSCREYTAEWLRDRIADGYENPFAKDEVFKATQYMSSLIWQSIGEVVIAARAAMDWLQKCAKVVAAEELPVYWTTPVGFPVMQDYKNTAQRRVKTKLGDSVVKLTVSDELDTINKRRMANAISPNFVHSMDATHLVMSVAYAHDNGIDSFAMIHDSFGTHAANTNLLAACLREAFVDLYSGLDVLEDFREQILRQVSLEDQDKIPPVPSKGGLDLEAVRASDFFFA